MIRSSILRYSRQMNIASLFANTSRRLVPVGATSSLRSLSSALPHRPEQPLESASSTFDTDTNFSDADVNHHPHHPTLKHHHRFTAAHVDVTVPECDYYEGHLLADHLEYLEDVLEKTLELENSIQELQTKQQAKRDAVFRTIGWTDSVEIQTLFDDTSHHTGNIRQHTAGLKEMISDVHQKLSANVPKPFAVEAPDGTSDLSIRDEIQQAQTIAEEQRNPPAPQRTDKTATTRTDTTTATITTPNVWGVDAPDGRPDAVDYEVAEQVKRMGQ